MKKHYCFFLIIILLPLLLEASTPKSKENKYMSIKITFNNQEAIMQLYNNPTAKEVIKQLPLNLKFQDFAGKEKIAYFPQKISLKDAPKGAIPIAGEVTIYAPWGNLAIFYKEHGTSPDNTLVPIGKIQQGLKHLSEMKKDFSARMEIIKD